jgi:hypothetical protein
MFIFVCGFFSLIETNGYMSEQQKQKMQELTLLFLSKIRKLRNKFLF